MKFPGQRKSKHYFPVDDKANVGKDIRPIAPLKEAYICGIDQTVMDIEAHVSDEFITRYGLEKGSSHVVREEKAEALYQEAIEQNLIAEQFAGGTIANSMHNYSVLADDRSVLFGVMSKNIKIGSYAYHYLCNTSSRVDLNYLHPVEGSIGRCFTLITPDGERTFAISKGDMDKFSPDAMCEEVIKHSSAFVFSAYLVRAAKEDGIFDAAMKAIKVAKANGVPVVLTLGTRFIIDQDREFWQQFIADNVNIVAMNEDEGEALTGHSDPLLAADSVLDWADMVLCTAGPLGLFMAGYTDEQQKRTTTNQLLPGAIAEFNRYEYSRPMKREMCQQPIKVYSHISPYMGGPERISNTNGAGDGALSALLHDLASNHYHKANVPNSSKHKYDALCYSSFAQVCKYANRVAYQVLAQNSPRLSRALPEREDSLEEVYWER